MLDPELQRKNLKLGWAVFGLFVLLFAGTFVNRVGGLVLIFLAIYLTEVRGLTPAQAGAVVAAYGIGAKTIKTVQSGIDAVIVNGRLIRRDGKDAVAADDKDANAHFALFCNMGEAMRVDDPPSTDGTAHPRSDQAWSAPLSRGAGRGARSAHPGALR